MPEALAALLEHRGLAVATLGSLLRAEGLTISRTRLHQIIAGQGAPATGEQIERLAAVLGVGPSHFAEYRLLRTRALIDPRAVGFERAMANHARLSGASEPNGATDDGHPGDGRYPGPSQSTREHG